MIFLIIPDNLYFFIIQKQGKIINYRKTELHKTSVGTYMSKPVNIPFSS